MSVPVEMPLSGEIYGWIKSSSQRVLLRETLCYIIPDVAPYRRDEVHSPATGFFTSYQKQSLEDGLGEERK